jgi:hypothetical protein
MRCVSDKIVEKIKTHILCSKTYFRTSRLVCDKEGKYDAGGQATDDNMAHTHCIPDTKGYKHTLKIRNAYCFSTATIVERTRLSVDVLCAFPVWFCADSGLAMGQSHIHVFRTKWLKISQFWMLLLN